MRKGERLLLIAPHPDDEVLAAAGLLQRARREGMQIRIWQLSDGESNPWPQRWLERRLRIRAEDRLRWGARRGAETRAGLRCLGLPGETRACMHWADLGLNTRIREQLVPSVQALAARLANEQPDLVVLPALGDRHPDHSAAHVLVQLALFQARLQPACLQYVVHGARPAGPHAWRVPLDAAMRAAKQAAILEHRTQLALSRRRMLEHAGTEEIFEPCRRHRNGIPSARVPWTLPWQLLRPLRLTLACARESWVWTGREAPIRRSDGRLVLELPDAARQGGPLYLRLECPWCSPWIYDRWGWQCLTPGR